MYVVLALLYSLISFIFVIKTCVKLHLCVSLAPAEKNPLIEKARERAKESLREPVIRSQKIRNNLKENITVLPHKKSEKLSKDKNAPLTFGG